MFRMDIQFVYVSIEITSKKTFLELLHSIEPVDGNRFRKIFELYLDWLWGPTRKLAMRSCHEGISFWEGGV